MLLLLTSIAFFLAVQEIAAKPFDSFVLRIQFMPSVERFSAEAERQI
jgi:hypothetical protein